MLISFKPGYLTYQTTTQHNVVVLEILMATNHPVLNIYVWYYKYILELHPHLSKKEAIQHYEGDL
jgi:hypothetical protein